MDLPSKKVSSNGFAEKIDWFLIVYNLLDVSTKSYYFRVCEIRLLRYTLLTGVLYDGMINGGGLFTIYYFLTTKAGGSTDDSYTLGLLLSWKSKVES